MIKLNLNKDTNKEFEQITAGDYEVTVLNFEPKKVGDKNVISVDYEIRSDVDQEFKGQKIRFDDFFCTERALWKIENASIAAGFTEAEATFEKYSEWGKRYVGKNLCVNVVINAKGYPEVKKYMPTAHPAGEIEVDDSEVPF
ncbi:DUF669 domain-containing protein [Mesobacillus sp. S13]|uniref:DUF669 domain-containing protein n=1 Tax=Mesobacillus sp. S13 TaxID=2880221 RepID=UPI001CF1F57D|nr:DUF669 domain-containing protein [Mesobacillus sp. S13]